MAMKKAMKPKAKKGGDLAGVGTPETPGRTAQRGIDQANRKLKEPNRASYIRAAQLKEAQSKQDKGGRARTDARFKAQDKKMTKKRDTKKMALSIKRKQYEERKAGQ